MKKKKRSRQLYRFNSSDLSHKRPIKAPKHAIDTTTIPNNTTRMIYIIIYVHDFYNRDIISNVTKTIYDSISIIENNVEVSQILLFYIIV